VKAVVSGANPTDLPNFINPHNVSHAEVVEAAGCNPVLTRCDSGGSLHFSLGHEGVGKPAHLGSARYPGQHRGARPFYTEVQPDQRAGTVLKTDCSPRANGGQHLGLPPIYRKLPDENFVQKIPIKAAPANNAALTSACFAFT
jgi:hypothetical protein